MAEPTVQYGWARDRDIRALLRKRLSEQHADERDALLVEEMGLCQGEARVDLGVVNGQLIGYEIKSPHDTLDRLPSQIDVYGRSLDVVHLVTCDAHIAGSMELIPEWWGVWTVAVHGSYLDLHEVRTAGTNPNVDALAIVQLLWRPEALALLEEHGIAAGAKSLRRQQMWDRLCENLSLDQLRSAVRAALKARSGWTTAKVLG